MRPTTKIMGTLLIGAGVLLMAGDASAAPAPPKAEFSAIMLVKDGGREMPGKIYVHDGKMRQEFIDERGRTVTIVRPDKKLIWIVMPLKGVYMEMPLKRELPGQFIQIPPQALQKRPLGRDEVNGYLTDKFQVMVPVGRQREIQTYWVATKLGLPIKMECRTRHFGLEYQCIREAKVPDRLFDLPAGVKKVTDLGSFADKVQP
jgi:hypothetical protein